MLQFFTWLQKFYDKGAFQCPECGSWNTWSSAKVDCCEDCGYTQGYP